MTEVKIEHIKELLRITKARADLNGLVKHGLRYSQIGKLIAHSIQTGYLQAGGEKLIVTKKGLELLKEEVTANGGWIRPKDEARIDKISNFDVYLPPKKTIKTLH